MPSVASEVSSLPPHHSPSGARRPAQAPTTPFADLLDDAAPPDHGEPSPPPSRSSARTANDASDRRRTESSRPADASPTGTDTPPAPPVAGVATEEATATIDGCEPCADIEQDKDPLAEAATVDPATVHLSISTEAIPIVPPPPPPPASIAAPDAALAAVAPLVERPSAAADPLAAGEVLSPGTVPPEPAPIDQPAADAGAPTEETIAGASAEEAANPQTTAPRTAPSDAPVRRSTAARGAATTEAASLPEPTAGVTLAEDNIEEQAPPISSAPAAADHETEAKPRESTDAPGEAVDGQKNAQDKPLVDPPRTPGHEVNPAAGHANGGSSHGSSHGATVLPPTEAMAMRGPAESSSPIAGLALEIAARAQAGHTRFEIRLDPPELGRVDVRLDVDRHGQVTSRLVVERAETLDLLRRDAPELERALQQAGLKTSDDGLQFSLRDQGFGGRHPQAHDDAARLLLLDPDAPQIETAAVSYGRDLHRASGIDIRV